MVTYTVDPGGKFRKAVSDAIKAVGDLTVPFTLITKSWYKSNQAIFSLKSPGKYPPLGGFSFEKKVKGQPYTYRQRAEARKRAKVGFAYPLLVGRTGRLSESLLSPGADGAVNYIINGKALLLGTNIPYGIFHQSLESRTKLPFRPFLFIGGEQTAPSDEINNRQKAWTAQIESYVQQVLDKSVRAP